MSRCGRSLAPRPAPIARAQGPRQALWVSGSARPTVARRPPAVQLGTACGAAPTMVRAALRFLQAVTAKSVRSRPHLWRPENRPPMMSPSPEMASATLVNNGKRRVRVGSRCIFPKLIPPSPARVQSRKRTANDPDHDNHSPRTGSALGKPWRLTWVVRCRARPAVPPRAARS